MTDSPPPATTIPGQQLAGLTQRWSVDPKSYELAEHFAQGENLTEAELKELSQAIQDCCEDFLSFRRDRDEVLFAFHQACERPTAEQIIEWTQRYPPFADDIRDHAAVRLDAAP